MLDHFERHACIRGRGDVCVVAAAHDWRQWDVRTARSSCFNAAAGDDVTSLAAVSRHITLPLVTWHLSLHVCFMPFHRDRSEIWFGCRINLTPSHRCAYCIFHPIMVNLLWPIACTCTVVLTMLQFRRGGVSQDAAVILLNACVPMTCWCQGSGLVFGLAPLDTPSMCQIVLKLQTRLTAFMVSRACVAVRTAG